MKFSPQQYAQALYDSVQEVNPKDYDLIMDKFVKILAVNGDLNKHAEIETEFRRIEMNAKGIKDVTVTVAHDIQMNKGILDDLNKIIKSNVASDKPIQTEIKSKVDDTLVGGIVVRVDDTLIDASVRGQLDSLNEELKQ